MWINLVTCTLYVRFADRGELVAKSECWRRKAASNVIDAGLVCKCGVGRHARWAVDFALMPMIYLRISWLFLFKRVLLGNYARNEERDGASPLQMMSRRFRQPREMPRHHLRAGPIPFFGFRERQSIGKFDDGPRHVVGQAGVRAGCGCFRGWPGKHVAFPVSGSTLWRRHVPAYVLVLYVHHRFGSPVA